jgi:DNA polymerase-3 subunit epsilon
MLGLIFDTETTGLWQKGAPCGDARQPKLVQLAAILRDIETRREFMRTSLVIYRTEPIPAEATKVHGTTQEISQALGIDERDALNIFARMVESADVMIAHNIEFDVNIMNNAARLMADDPSIDLFEGKKKFCTMLASVPVCKLPSKYGHPGYAWPKLEVAVRTLLGREPSDAHQAIGDAIDCDELFFHLQDLIAERQAVPAEARA